MAEFAELEAEVARNKSVIGSAAALINGIADRVDEAIRGERRRRQYETGSAFERTAR